MDRFVEDDFLARYVTWALWAFALLVCLATITGQVESYNGLYIWFATHHVTGIWADIAPLAVDSFTILGELAIFAGIARHWHWPSRILPWVSAVLGIVASVAANVGDKVQFHSIPTDLTAAVLPLAGAFGLVMGMGVLKRLARDHAERKARKNQESAEPVAGPSVETLTRVQEAIEKRPDIPELKGMDVLIPPIPMSPPETAETHDVATVEPPVVSREEARRRLTDRPGRQVIDPQGLDVTATGAQPFTVYDVLNYQPN